MSSVRFVKVLVAVLIVGLLQFACAKKEENARRGGRSRPASGMFESGAIPVKVDTVKIEPISTYILTNTTLEAQRRVEVIARVSGIARKILAEEGDVVRRNQTLVKLDDAELRLIYEQAKASLENARRAFERTKEMFEKNLISKEAYDDAEFKYETAKSQYKTAKLQLEYATIRAPVNGIITSRMVEIGDYVTINRAVYAMADYDTLLARIHVPEREIAKIRPGQVARIRLEAFPEREFTGRVMMISPVVDPASGTIKVTVKIVRKKTPLLPGMFCSVYIVTETHDQAMIIPKKALLLESETDRVFVYDNGVARLRDIKTGFSDGDRLEVLEGLQPGELVITVGQEGLRDGSKVRVIGSEARVAAVRPPASGEQKPAEAQNKSPQAGAAKQGQNMRGRGEHEITPEQLARIEKRMLRIPFVRQEYEKRVQADPEFKNNLEKKAAFFREMRQRLMEMRGRQGR